MDFSDDSNPKSPEAQDTDVIQLVSLPNGKKQLSFRMEQISSKVPTNTPELNQIYSKLVHILQKRTNFELLDNQGDYLMAIARLLESAYFNTKLTDGQKSQDLFNALASQLVVYSVQDSEKSIEDNTQHSTDSKDIESEINNNLKHYATSEDFHEEKQVKFTTQDSQEVKSDEVNVKSNVHVSHEQNEHMTIDVTEELIKVTESVSKHPAGQENVLENQDLQDVSSDLGVSDDIITESLDTKSNTKPVEKEDVTKSEGYSQQKHGEL